MIFIVGLAVLAGLLAFYDTGDLAEGFWGGVCGGVVGAVLALIVGAFVYTGVHPEPVANVPLVSLADGSGVRGSFSFLGAGSVDERPVFTWYEKTADNAYVRKHADADASVIHYLRSDAHPRLIVEQDKPTDHHTFKTWGLNTTSDGEKTYHFYVPSGSIVQHYDLDNQ
jgi:hypothetical protein